MKTLNALRQIEPLLASNPLPKAARAWGGADMAISPSSNQDVSSGGFYPAPRCVVTTHTLEVSWLFEALRDAFYAENRLRPLKSCVRRFFTSPLRSLRRCWSAFAMAVRSAPPTAT